MRRGPRSTRAALAATAVVGLAVLAGCGVGASEGGTGKTAINFYAFNEPGGSYDKAVEDCNKEADGKYTISYVKLPTDANQQRELVVRRLAAEDEDIDIIGMDVIWTAEFAAAEWILPWEGDDERAATEGKLAGPRKTVEFEDKVFGLPFTSNTQLLWYRKDKVGTVPDDITWDKLIDDAASEPTGIEVQAAQYEGLTVLVNSLIAGAGGQIVNEAGDVKVDSSATRAAEILSKLGTSKAAPPGMATNKEDEARIGFEEERSFYEINYPFIYPSAEAVGKKFQDSIGWARYPRTVADQPSKPPLGGINLGISKYSETPDLAFEAARCLATDEHQAIAAELGGLPPTTESVYETKKVQDAYPFADLLRESIDEASPRPVTPAYSDISLAIQKTFHPPDGIDAGSIESKLKDRIERAGEGKIY